MVRLLQVKCPPLKHRWHPFNPTMVRLLPLTLREIQRRYGPFNPTMVRLLPYFIQQGKMRSDCFQSHNGAIAALQTLNLRI